MDSGTVAGLSTDVLGTIFWQGVDLVISWGGQFRSLFFCVDSGRKGNEGVARRMNHSVQLKILQGVFFNWYPPKCFNYKILC